MVLPQAGEGLYGKARSCEHRAGTGLAVFFMAEYIEFFINKNIIF